MKSLSLLVVTFLLAATASAADLKIGVVDMNRAYEEYYKSKERNALRAKNAAEANEKFNDRKAKYEKLIESAQSLDKQSKDVVLSEQIRKQKYQELERLAPEIRALSKDMQEFRALANQKLQTEEFQHRQEGNKEIIKAVQEKAAADGYDLVFDKSGAGITFTPLLLHSKEGVTTDFTSELIVQLNKDAPTGAASAPAPEKKETESKGTEKKGSGKSK